MSASFDLASFLPFRLNRLASELSLQLAECYRQEASLNTAEWRVLATLAARQPQSARAIALSSRTHKSSISRAVDSLCKRHWLEKYPNPDDHREQLIRFTEQGHAGFNQLEPAVLEIERTLLASFNPAQQQQINDTLTLLERTLDLHREN